MVSTTIYVVVTIIACVLLLILAICATAAAFTAHYDPEYYVIDTGQWIRNSYYYISITAAMAWVAFFFLLAVFGLFVLLNQWTMNQCPQLPQWPVSMSAERYNTSMAITTMIVLGVTFLLTVAIAITSGIALYNVYNAEPTTKSNTVYVLEIISLITGILAIGFVAASFAYYWRIIRDIKSVYEVIPSYLAYI
jgi:hypothetical protein